MSPEKKQLFVGYMNDIKNTVEELFDKDVEKTANGVKAARTRVRVKLLAIARLTKLIRKIVMDLSDGELDGKKDGVSV